MAWFALARLLFVGAVSYTAYQLHPLAGDLSNLLLGFALGGVFVALEIRLKDISVTRLIGALLGGALGLIAARTVGAALYWADLSDTRVVFLHSVVLLALPYVGLVMGARKGEWFEPANASSRLFRQGRLSACTSYKILDTSA